MAFTVDELAAMTRLSQYNGNPYDSVSNPYGLGGVGYRANPDTGFIGNWAQTTADIALVAPAIQRETTALVALAQAAATTAQNVAVGFLKTSSTTSLSVGTGSKSFTCANNLDTSVPIPDNAWLEIVSVSDPTKVMIGTVTSASGTSLVMNITKISGSGTANDWSIFGTGKPGADGAAGADGDLDGILTLASGLDSGSIAEDDKFAVGDTSAGVSKYLTFQELVAALTPYFD